MSKMKGTGNKGNFGNIRNQNFNFGKQNDLCRSAVFVHSLRPSQGFWGTGEQGHLFQGNKGLNNEGNKGTKPKAVFGNREHKNSRF